MNKSVITKEMLHKLKFSFCFLSSKNKNDIKFIKHVFLYFSFQIFPRNIDVRLQIILYIFRSQSRPKISKFKNQNQSYREK